MWFKKFKLGTSLAVEWLRHHACTLGGTGSMPGRGAKIPHPCGQKKKIKLVPFPFYLVGPKV